jgi:hypothetical protein
MHSQKKSAAEQNSVNLAWGLLMEDQFEVWRKAIYTKLERFHQLVVNAVSHGNQYHRQGAWTTMARLVGDDLPWLPR